MAIRTAAVTTASGTALGAAATLSTVVFLLVVLGAAARTRLSSFLVALGAATRAGFASFLGLRFAATFSVELV